MTTKVVSIEHGGFRGRVEADRNSLIEAHMSLVVGIAAGIHRDMARPGSFDLADLIGTGNLALCRAAVRFRPAEHAGVPFAAWARLKIRGAILDSMRRGKLKDATMPGISSQGGERDTSLPPVLRWKPRHGVTTMDTGWIDRARRRRRIADAITELSESEQAVLWELYSTDRPTVRETGARLGIGTRRVRYLQGVAIATLRARLA